MNSPDWRTRIAANSSVCHGKPCIEGTRIMVSTVLDNLKDGDDFASVLRDFPTLSEADVRAAIGYAACLAHEEEDPPLRGSPRR